MGFVVGLLVDSLTPSALARALWPCRSCLAASWLKAVFFADNLALNGFFFFAGRWAYAIIYVLAEHQRSASISLRRSSSGHTLSGAVTAAAGVILLVMIRPLLEPAGA